MVKTCSYSTVSWTPLSQSWQLGAGSLHTSLAFSHCIYCIYYKARRFSPRNWNPLSPATVFTITVRTWCEKFISFDPPIITAMLTLGEKATSAWTSSLEVTTLDSSVSLPSYVVVMHVMCLRYVLTVYAGTEVPSFLLNSSKGPFLP